MADLASFTPRWCDQPTDTPWPTSDWPEGPRRAALDAVVSEGFDDADLAETNAVLVVAHGRIVAERYGGTTPSFTGDGEPVGPSTPLISWSMAKSVLHGVVGLLVDEGRLDPAAPAPVAPWRDDARGAITLADLLAMRDGLDFVESYDVDQPSHVIEMLFGPGRADMGAYAAARPLAHEPDTTFNYSSGTTNIISRLVADVVGRGEDYHRFLAERLFQPIGATSARATLDESGVFVASSFLHATARDYARFALLYLRGGRWGEHRLLSPEWVATAQVPRSRDPESGFAYAWQWWVTGDEYGTYEAHGYEGQLISVVPALDAIIVRLGRTPEDRASLVHEWRTRLLAVLAAG